MRSALLLNVEEVPSWESTVGVIPFWEGCHNRKWHHDTLHVSRMTERCKNIRGFPKINLSRIELIELIELIWMILGIVNINSCVTSKLPITKKGMPFTVHRVNINVICLQCVVFKIFFLLLLVIIIQHVVKIGLVTENLIPNHQSMFFKWTQLA